MEDLFRQINEEDGTGAPKLGRGQPNLYIDVDNEFAILLSLLRSSVLAGLAVITAALCILKLVRLHMAGYPSCHQYVIFYAASFECAIA